METSRGSAGAALTVLLGLSACPGSPPPPSEPEGGSLVELTAWERVADVNEDVFGAERPEGLICDELLGIGTEMFGPELALELNTDLCNYVTVRQPTLLPVLAGDTVSLRAWHYELTAPAPAQAHLALALDGTVVWETFIDTPADGKFVDAAVVVERDLPAGTDLQFHIHNHGPNSYALLSIERVTGESDGGATG